MSASRTCRNECFPYFPSFLPSFILPYIHSFIFILVFIHSYNNSFIHISIHSRFESFIQSKLKYAKLNRKTNENVIKMRTGASVNIIHQNPSKCHKNNLKYTNIIKRPFSSGLWLLVLIWEIDSSCSIRYSSWIPCNTPVKNGSTLGYSNAESTLAMKFPIIWSGPRSCLEKIKQSFIETFYQTPRVQRIKSNNF